MTDRPVSDAADPGAVPIDADEADRHLAPLAAYTTVALAVSGGGDSLALLHLAAAWRARREAGPRLTVLTFDHGLRATSAEEARHVAAIAAAHGLPHQTLPWVGVRLRSGLQDAARTARYEAFGARLAAEPGPVALVTAHTLEDQAETLLMRLARGSGVSGLAGMAPCRPLVAGQPGLDLVRPLLDVPGARLRATLRAAGLVWIEDPTNSDLTHERPRLRAARAARDVLGLSDLSLARTARRLRRAHEAVVWGAHQLAAAAMTEQPGLVVMLDRGRFDAGPVELRERLLAAILVHMGGDHPGPRLVEVERLAMAIAPGVDGRAWTLGGAVVRVTATTIRVVREIGRQRLPVLTLAPGTAARWDGRFEVTVAPTAPGPVRVRAATAADDLSNDVSEAADRDAADLGASPRLLPLPRDAMATAPVADIAGRPPQPLWHGSAGPHVIARGRSVFASEPP